jgi:hypothetical protein
MLYFCQKITISQRFLFNYDLNNQLLITYPLQHKFTREVIYF